MVEEREAQEPAGGAELPAVEEAARAAGQRVVAEAGARADEGGRQEEPEAATA